ncbi:MAG: rhodanese-like domain-containing protein [Roseivirga sp.]|nr:rhodanese-like domain-containing protein [Roseivirga sp.]
MISLFKKRTAGFEQLSAEAFRTLQMKSNPIILDVRSPEELSEGIIPNYRQINFFNTSFREELSRLDRSKSYLVYCRSGNRSRKACKMMSSMGFENLYNLAGGIQAWNALVRN